MQLVVEAPLALAILGFFLKSKLLLWGGLIGFGVMLAAGVVYGLSMGIYVPFHTVRNWKKYPLGGKIILASSSLVILLLLGGIGVAAWMRYRGG